MYDRFDRKINYLRVSVTDRCNLRCVYCMPAGGVKLLEHKDILNFDEIVDVVRAGIGFGIDKVRITGGEPLVRKGIIDLIGKIGKIEGIKDFSMTTNGYYLSRHAKQLVDAGLQRVNISLDTINPEKYKSITRVGDIKMVFKGIDAALEAGLKPVKINCVVKESKNETNAREVADFCSRNGLEIRFIREMDLEKGQYWKVDGGEGGNCALCNRLRLTSDGKIKPCLFSDIEYNVRELGAQLALEKAIKNKPKSGTVSSKNKFSGIGG